VVAYQEPNEEVRRTAAEEASEGAVEETSEGGAEEASEGDALEEEGVGVEAEAEAEPVSDKAETWKKLTGPVPSTSTAGEQPRSGGGTELAPVTGGGDGGGSGPTGTVTNTEESALANGVWHRHGNPKRKLNRLPGAPEPVYPAGPTAPHVIHCVLYSLSPRHPPHTVSALATSSTAYCIDCRHVIHRILYRCSPGQPPPPPPPLRADSEGTNGEALTPGVLPALQDSAPKRRHVGRGPGVHDRAR
jgi:hypothetical protein